MTRYREGDWVRFRGSEGFTVEKKVLEVRPDRKLVVGDHDHDPQTLTVTPENISKKITK